jgi:L-fucose isomerase-like protein
MSAIRLVDMTARIRRVKIGLVGGHAPGFINMRAEPVLLARCLGVQLQEFSLPEFFTLVDAQDQKMVEGDVERVLALGIPLGDGLRREDLLDNSRYYLALRSLMADENLDAIAVRCWPEMPFQRGAWPYLAMCRLADQRQVVSLEGDVDGAISCLIARLLRAWPAYISDWLEHDSRSILLWHPGQAPRAICQPGSLRLGRHFNTRHPVVVESALVLEEPVTLLRVWHCDGVYRLAAWEGQTVAPRRAIAGVHGQVEVHGHDVRELFDRLCHAGMPHHVIVAQGHHAKMFQRAARLLGLKWESL